MTCKDCINSDMCLEADKDLICRNFKDRARFVELPFEIGSTVYILDYDDGEPYDYSGYILLMANKNHALLSPIVNDEEDPYELCEGYFEGLVEDDYPYCGGCVIVPIHELMTREEAEQALKEREKHE